MKTIFGIDSFSYFRLNVGSSLFLQKLLSQFIETYLEQGECTCLVDLSKNTFDEIAQAYTDLLIGFRHPRVDSAQWRYRQNDPTLKKLMAKFPDVDFPSCQSRNE